ncbi:putative mitochondrial hypothetical protein [Leptomonas pyrrhocoris]|uniref:Uncharacterized protein n=1 Tax=Leptomonas pyrrhocoris TaxID=157538 RepID=A0A0M9FWD7_LEPPY|nr:putative mitochondrial hypothetical protein [Leptomonas pyrrhocoris]KPA77317.1 putative mitochondrial hypothetical protein [Leptomonas pyrrhocoris]|eukprot:XP_015655756.1 putative mitochondrial hypothetical protein [Leptomonas pyrrhocoris]
MFTLASRRLMRVSAVVPRLFSTTACLVASSATTIGIRNSDCGSQISPLSSGVSTRSFSTSSLCFAAAFQLNGVRLQRNTFKTRARHTGHHQPERQLRLHGTVTAFKHRRGYGFVLAEGIVPSSHKPVYTSLDALNQKATTGSGDSTAAAGSATTNNESTAEEGTAAASQDEMLPNAYFFTRSSLDGGFYVTEGERVSFAVEPRQPDLGTKRYLGAPAYNSAAGRAGPAAAALAEEFSLHLAEAGATSAADASAAAPHLLLAVAMRQYDDRSQTESPITPITLYGRVMEWDDVAGRGVIAELDMSQQYHADAPRFAVSIENVDLGRAMSLHAGRYVRFCLGPASTSNKSGGPDAAEDGGEAAGAAAPTTADAAAAATTTAGGGGDQLVAQRVIIDMALERRRGAFGRPLVPASAEPGTVTDQTRFSGIVRDIREKKFGFIIDDLSGESIFFHAVNARANVKEGDRVTYLLREVTRGKHVGKKACFDVTRAARAGDRCRRERSAADPVAAMEDEEEDGEEADLLEVEEEETATEGEPASNTASRTTKKKKAPATTRRVDELDFNLL